VLTDALEDERVPTLYDPQKGSPQQLSAVERGGTDVTSHGPAYLGRAHFLRFASGPSGEIPESRIDEAGQDAGDEGESVELIRTAWLIDTRAEQCTLQ